MSETAHRLADPVDWPWTFDLSSMPGHKVDLSLSADVSACAQVARALDLPNVLDVTFKGRVSLAGKVIWHLKGTLDAHVTQICVITLEEITTVISTDIDRKFVLHQPSVHKPIKVLDVGYDEDEPDVLETPVILLSDVVIETLSLALDPYPRKTGVVFEETGDESGEDAPSSDRQKSPFAALKSMLSDQDQ